MSHEIDCPVVQERSLRRTIDLRIDLVEGAAVSGSVLCLVHCLALPLLLLLLPSALGVLAQSEAFHFVTLTLVAPAAGAAFWLGFLRHSAWQPALLGLAGLALLFTALLVGVDEHTEVLLTILGSFLLVVGHVQNWRRRRHAC